MAKFDQIIRNCKIINGCGTPWFMADLAINSNKIAAIGLLKDCWAHFEYDAKGSFLTPGMFSYIIYLNIWYLLYRSICLLGFIDSHTHDDISILRDPKHLCKIGQGVTTIVTGNCSFSNYPFKDNDIHSIRHLSSLLGI
jgi:N-acyl-D-amino-acid deacylase